MPSAGLPGKGARDAREPHARLLPGHFQGRLAGLDGFVEEGAEAVSDGGEEVLDVGFGEMGDLSGDGCDDAAGAHHGVGCPGDTACVQQVGHEVVGELVIGGADDGAAAQGRDCLRGEDAAQCRGHQDVGVAGEQAGRVSGAGGPAAGEPVAVRVGVGYHEGGALACQRVRDQDADVAESLDGEGQLAGRAAAEDAVADGVDAGERPGGGGGRGVAAAARVLRAA